MSATQRQSGLVTVNSLWTRSGAGLDSGATTGVGDGDGVGGVGVRKGDGRTASGAGSRSITWNGMASAGAAFGMAMATLGRWQKDTFKLRWFFVLCSLGWGAHNTVVGSPFGLASDTMCFVSNLWRLRGELSLRRGVDVRCVNQFFADHRVTILEIVRDWCCEQIPQPAKQNREVHRCR